MRLGSIVKMESWFNLRMCPRGNLRPGAYVDLRLGASATKYTSTHTYNQTDKGHITLFNFITVLHSQVIEMRDLQTQINSYMNYI